MTAPLPWKPDPRLDLVLERVVDVTPELVWAAWTRPEHVRKWFTPAPWTVTDCEIDLRPGGIFRTVMRSPEGKELPNVGCFLEIVPNRRLVWTDALLPGYRPSGKPFFTAVISLEPQGNGTRYTAVAETLRVNPTTVSKLAQKYQSAGLACLQDQARSGRPTEIDGVQRAKVTALACSDAPEGYDRWTLRMLADKAVELGYCEHLSHTEVGTILKKTNSSPI